MNHFKDNPMQALVMELLLIASVPKPVGSKFPRYFQFDQS